MILEYVIMNLTIFNYLMIEGLTIDINNLPDFLAFPRRHSLLLEPRAIQMRVERSSEIELAPKLEYNALESVTTIV